MNVNNFLDSGTNWLNRFSQKEFLPVIVAVITVFLVLFLRPRFLVNQNGQARSILVALIVLLTGGLTYFFVY